MSLFVNESQLASADADKANVIQPSTPCHTISAWTGDFGGLGRLGGEQAKCWALMRAELAVLSDFT